MKAIIFLTVCLLSISAKAGQQFANTLSIHEHTPQSASIQDLSWIAGTWRGTRGTSSTETIWSEPMGNSIMGVFRSVKEGKVRFYEILTITEQDNSLVLKLKHFAGDLKGWEEKDEYMQRYFIKVEGNRAYFDGYTFEKRDDNTLVEYVVVSNDKTGEKTELSFAFTRIH